MKANHEVKARSQNRNCRAFSSNTFMETKTALPFGKKNIQAELLFTKVTRTYDS